MKTKHIIGVLSMCVALSLYLLVTCLSDLNKGNSSNISFLKKDINIKRYNTENKASELEFNVPNIKYKRNYPISSNNRLNRNKQLTYTPINYQENQYKIKHINLYNNYSYTNNGGNKTNKDDFYVLTPLCINNKIKSDYSSINNNEPFVETGLKMLNGSFPDFPNNPAPLGDSIIPTIIFLVLWSFYKFRQTNK